VARLLGDRQPILMVTDPPYGIELDSEWRDRAGLNGGDFGSKRTRASKARAAADPQHGIRVHTSITRIRLKSKAIVKEIDRGEGLAMVSIRNWRTAVR
jgi:hypothetical protein